MRDSWVSSLRGRYWYTALLGGWLLCAPATGAAAEIDGETLLDPTRPMGARAVQDGEGGAQSDASSVSSGPARYRVNFIRAGGDTPMAVVNDQIVTVGDEVNGAEVLSIKQGVVRLGIDDGETVVSAWSASIRETANE